MVLWGSPGRDGKDGGGKLGSGRRDGGIHRGGSLAESTSELRIFAPRTGRIEVKAEVLAAQLAQPEFSPAQFIQTHMSKLTAVGLENAKQELDGFMAHVQNMARVSRC